MQEEVQKISNTKIGDIYLSMKGITKVYGNGVLANNQVDFEVRKGEIHALMGENGAGKSTLMKVLFGNELPDAGTITLDGKEVTIDSPKTAVALGIGMVYQHFNLADSLTIAENIVVGSEPNEGVFFDRDNAIKIVNSLAERYGFNVKADELVRNISVCQKQKTEILKILFRDSQLIILDEPTAVLTPQETDELFEQLKMLKDNGYTIIFISHKIDEVMRLCDRVTIMRAGRHMGTYDISDLTARDISRLMVGRDVIQNIEKPDHPMGKTVLKVDELNFYDKHNVHVVNNMSFCLHKGEILGVAGVEGSGQKEMSEIITGLLPPFSGKVFFEGEDITEEDIAGRRKHGMSHIHEDRMTYGAAMNESIEENLISIRNEDPDLGSKLFLDRKKIRSLAEDLIKRFSVLCKSPDVPVKMLSGGNMQKVVVARELSVSPKVIIANQPTRGIDVGAVELIHKTLIEARENDCGVLLITSDLNEVLDLSDSLIVLHGGKIVGYFRDVKKLTEEELGLYMLGLKEQSEAEIREAVADED
ncbi:MAG: ABC transporter ATP-binding protein [Oscillospiraceae bacterium]|nr:ABC transporter ATP-binding protein [Oscillospiraceae bacterium]